jgi:hypothetical protein
MTNSDDEKRGFVPVKCHRGKVLAFPNRLFAYEAAAAFCYPDLKQQSRSMELFAARLVSTLDVSIISTVTVMRLE